jgi:hypothetical protein
MNLDYDKLPPCQRSNAVLENLKEQLQGISMLIIEENSKLFDYYKNGEMNLADAVAASTHNHRRRRNEVKSVFNEWLAFNPEI